MGRLRANLDYTSIDDIIQQGLHEFIDDFQIQESDRIINVGNAPSPAATSSLNIGRLIVDKLAERF